VIFSCFDIAKSLAILIELAVIAKIEYRSLKIFEICRLPLIDFLYLVVMENQLKISIPTPCHENLSLMDKTENGKFCLSCQKEVIDFTKMTDEEIVLYFDKKKSGAAKVCGTFRVDQVLEKEKMIEIPIQTYFYAKTNHQKFLWMLFACMGMFFVSCDSKTKGDVKITVVDSLENSKYQDTIENKEILLTGDTIYSIEPTEKPKKIEQVDKIQGEVVENVTGFVAPIVKGGCVIPENTEEELIVTIKGKVAYPKDTLRKQELHVSQKDTAANMDQRPPSKFIGIKPRKLFKD